jgi:hypothetical protein
MSNIKPIAFYLPQFHPIPENDKWWGKGFTEWTNVTKARPLFNGHLQPRLPADLGFYDLRVEETRIAQAELAREYGIYGFAYWHYWFGNGKQILERPFQEVLTSGKPDFPFCLAWANQTWSGTWHGLSNKTVLIEQTYPGEKDYINHFYSILPALKDDRYIRVNAKCLFMIFRTHEIPDLKAFTTLWQKLAKENNLNGFHFVSCHDNDDFLIENGINAFIQDHPDKFTLNKRSIIERIYNRFKIEIGINWHKKIEIIDYIKYVKNYPQVDLKENEYPMVFPDWDNSPRCGNDGWMFLNSSPQKFGEVVKKAIEIIKNKKINKDQIMIIKSWNEWAEGNYLEPDQKFGIQYLNALRDGLNLL